MLVGNVSDVMEQTTTDNIADLLNGRLRVDVTQVYGSVAEVVYASSRRRDGSSSNRLLSKSVGDHVAVCTVENVSVSRGNAKVLGSILLLCLRDVCAAILAVVDAPRSLPLRLLGKLCNSFDGVTDGQEVDETNRLLAHNLDCVNETKLAQIFAELFLGHILRQVAQVHIAGGTRLLHSKRNRSGDLRWLAPTNLDVLTTNRQLFQDCVRVEVGGRAAVKERDESTVLVGQEPDRFDLTTSYVAQDFLGGGLRGDVAQVDRPARSGDQSRGNGKRGSKTAKTLLSKALESRRLGSREETAGGGNETLVQTRRQGTLLHLRAAHLVLLLLLLLQLVLSSEGGKALELRRGEGVRRAGLERAAEEQLGGQERGEVHVEAGAGGLQLGVVVAWSEPTGVDVRNVGPLGVPVGVAGLVCVEGAVREASVSSIHLLLKTLLETRAAGRVRGAIVVLHSEQVGRQDKVVPRVLG